MRTTFKRIKENKGSNEKLRFLVDTSAKGWEGEGAPDWGGGGGFPPPVLFPTGLQKHTLQLLIKSSSDFS